MGAARRMRYTERMIRIGILRGGANAHYETSLETGAALLRALPEGEYAIKDIFVDRDGSWHMSGVPVGSKDLAERVDLVWNTLGGDSHRIAAETLERLGVPSVSMDAHAHRHAHEKDYLNARLSEHGIPGAQHALVAWDGRGREQAVAEASREVWRKLAPPWIVIPVGPGAAAGRPVRAKSRDELEAALYTLYDLGLGACVEQEVFGREAHVAVADGFRGQACYTFLPVWKATGRAHARAPENTALQKLARKAHRELGLGDYSLVRMAVSPRGAITVLGVETHPDMREGQPLEAARDAVGASAAEFAAHCISRATDKK